MRYLLSSAIICIGVLGANSSRDNSKMFDTRRPEPKFACPNALLGGNEKRPAACPRSENPAFHTRRSSGKPRLRVLKQLKVISWGRKTAIEVAAPAKSATRVVPMRAWGHDEVLVGWIREAGS
jgi:hypothetical protein